MKIAKVTVFKADDKKEMTNYHPIFILPLFSKIQGKVIFKRTMSYLNKHSIYYKNPYGFRQNHST